MPKENEKLQAFYDALLGLSDGEKQQYWEALRRELPNSFRFCGSKGFVDLPVDASGGFANAASTSHALAVKRLLQTRYIPEITKIEYHDGCPVKAPKPVPWYPDELAWWMTTPKNVIRKFAPFAAFQKFLVSETSVGNISRQEVVSMIPPLLMDLRPGMTALDMCAAPGSKAAQLLEMIHRGEEARVRKVLRSFSDKDIRDLGPETQDDADALLDADASDAGRATGLLIANDSDYKRGHMLVHQLKRLSSPNLLVTNHDATQFPSIRLPSSDKQAHYLKFDRILADVPCSGDGTLRKNANLWKDWTPGNALGLHTTQVRILVRALQLLKVGGRVVYSTCSMNPVENEAVVASAIDRCGGSANIDIVDSSGELPHLKRYPGMKAWKIMDKAGRIWSSWDEVETFAKESNEGVIPGRVIESMFPPSTVLDGSELPLDRCMRIYPHMQDTGAFFITVLEKKHEFRARNENEPKRQPENPKGAPSEATTPGAAEPRSEPLAPERTSVPATEPAQDEATGAQHGADTDVATTTGSKRPLEAKVVDEQQAKKARTDEPHPEATAPSVLPAQSKAQRRAPVEEPFKYLDPAHPVIQNITEFYKLPTRFPNNRYMVRNEMGEPAKAIYYTSGLMRDILVENEGRGMRFIHGGVRMFMKQDAPSAGVCRWRIQSEGMPILQGYVGEARVVHLRRKETFHKLLIEMFPRIAEDNWRKYDEIGEQVRDIGMGCCVLRVEPDGSDPDFTERMALPLWKSIHSLNLMLPKEDRSAMLLRLFNDSSPLVNTTLQKAQRPPPQRDPESPMDEDNAARDELDDALIEDAPSPE